ncbi:MAG: glycosyltransferase family protein [Polyangiaceae bacterium]
MRILYGVVGEGMGHAMRSRVILDHLVKEGHEIAIMASGRAVEFLAKRFTGVKRIHGFHIVQEENRVRRGRTLWSNVLAGTMGVPQNIAAYFSTFSSLKPEIVISDFESWTYLYAKAHRVPVVSIDNMQILNRCEHDPKIYEGHETDFQIAKTFVKGKLPFCDEYFITTFFEPKIRKPHTRLFPPILRPEILAAKSTRGDHLLVYQNAVGNEGLGETLAKTGLPCRIYGLRKVDADVVEGNLTYRPFSEAGFVDDLASARAVIGPGGFTLMGETVYLHKPLLAVPIGGQFEQVMNARYLEAVGYGKHAETLSDPATVHAFLEELDTYERALATYHQDGNKLILGALDEVLDRAQAGIL